MRKIVLKINKQKRINLSFSMFRKGSLLERLTDYGSVDPTQAGYEGKPKNPGVAQSMKLDVLTSLQYTLES